MVSHDRYFVERVTDQQYAILSGTLRHLPGGVDEYLRLRDEEVAAHSEVESGSGSQLPAEGGSSALSGAQVHALRKELSAIERKMDKATAKIKKIHAKMADADQSDYEKIGKLNQDVQALQDEAEELEMNWLEISEQLE